MNQTTKLLTQLAVFLLLAGAIGGYAYFGIFKKERDDARRKDHDLRLFAPQKLDERQADGGSPPANFTRAVVTFNGETTELEREAGEGWRVVKPVRAKADALVVDALISQLQSAKFKDTLDEKPDAQTLKKYGLDTPRFTVTATAVVNGEVRSVKLVGGLENTFDGSVFVQRDDEPAVYSAPGGVRYALSKSTYELRDKQPFALEQKQLQKLSVKSPNATYELTRDGKNWNLGADSADPSAVAGMINAVSSARAVRFLDDTPENRATYVGKPEVTALASFDGGSTVRLTASRVVSDGGASYYGLREADDGDVLAELGSDALSLERPVSTLRDQRVLRFAPELVTRVIFHNTDGVEVIVEKESVDASNESWHVTAPRTGKAKVFKVSGALWTLGNFKALGPGEEHPKDWAKYGIDAKARFIALYTDGDKELARFTIGKLVDGTPSAYWVRGARDQVLQSDGSRFTELPFDVADLLDEPDAGK